MSRHTFCTACGWRAPNGHLVRGIKCPCGGRLSSEAAGPPAVVTPDARALLDGVLDRLASELPPAIGGPLRDYSPIVLGILAELIRVVESRKVEVTAAPGVVPRVTIGE